MKRLAKSITLLIVIGFSLAIIGCLPPVVVKEEEPVYAPPPKESGPPSWAPAHGRRAKHRYHYYPDSYVYFDVGRGVYFYYSSNRWRGSASLPIGIHIDVNRYVVLEMDIDKPYRFHSDVVKRHPPGQLKKSDEDNGKRKGKGKGRWE